MHWVHYNTKYGSPSEAILEKDGLAVLGFMIDVDDIIYNKDFEVCILIHDRSKASSFITLLYLHLGDRVCCGQTRETWFHRRYRIKYLWSLVWEPVAVGKLLLLCRIFDHPSMFGSCEVGGFCCPCGHPFQSGKPLWSENWKYHWKKRAWFLLAPTFSKFIGLQRRCHGWQLPTNPTFE